MGKSSTKRGKSAPLDEDAEIEELKRRVIEEAPERGTQLKSDGLKFDTLPISTRTKEGLVNGKFITATDIQAAAIPHALAHRDILGAAKTGSGKTLAFVISLLEKLYVERWGPGDGLGALIITPTRELALQIFDVLRIVGKKHSFSAGLITGGKKEFEEEQLLIINMNILVATPGRLLQHFQQTQGFDASQLQMLVLDEADRILDMGFRTQLDEILQYLPPRQTLLFSATQTKSIKDLARLSLHQAEYVAVHDKDETATPTQLVQNYIVCPLEEKLNILYSFIKTHLKHKIIVFMSTCAQVRFVNECFCAMQPGIPIMALHGKIKQVKRTMIFSDFTRKKAACLLATDIAARGLDFPSVDWVVQLDAPEDTPMYIHRVGRTARYTAAGRALLIVMPCEEKAIMNELQQAGIPLKKLSLNPDRNTSVTKKAAALLAARPECRLLAKKAFTGYLRSLQLLARRSIYDVSSLATDAFSFSLGLAFPPPVPIVATAAAISESNEKKNVNRALDKLKKQIKEAKEAKKRAKALASAAAPSESSDEDDVLVPKQSTEEEETGSKRKLSEEELEVPVKSKKAKVMKINMDGEAKAAKRAGAKKMTFDDEGNVVDPLAKFNEHVELSGDALQQEMQKHTMRLKQQIDQGRHEDNLREKQRIREKHLKQKQQLKDTRQEQGPTLLNPVEEEEEYSSSGSAGGSDEESDDLSNNSSYSDDESDDDDDIRKQEELALRMLA